jgi:phospholipid/cholesterol/gamma-HCH transport system substrate-binding protein
MSKSRLEIKVGLFVFIGLVLLGILMLQFGKGTSLFRSTKTLRLDTKNAGGLKKQASVLMAGVQVGNVSDIQLAPDGKRVTVTLRIYNEFIIRDDAKFYIKQSGFLGDNYIDIDPGENAGKELANDASMPAEEPFDLQGVARSAAGFIQRVDDAAKKLNDLISDVRRLALNEQTLTNLAVTVETMRSASERALGTVEEINALFATNTPAISQSASNLVLASEEITRFATSLNSVLATNSEGIATSVKNIESSTAILKDVLEDVKTGKGLAGTVLYNDEVSSSVASIVNNLSITTSNLNRLGLWGILWSRKPPRTNEPPDKVYRSPKESGG